MQTRVTINNWFLSIQIRRFASLRYQLSEELEEKNLENRHFRPVFYRKGKVFFIVLTIVYRLFVLRGVPVPRSVVHDHRRGICRITGIEMLGGIQTLIGGVFREQMFTGRRFLYRVWMSLVFPKHT